MRFHQICGLDRSRIASADIAACAKLFLCIYEKRPRRLVNGTPLLVSISTRKSRDCDIYTVGDVRISSDRCGLKGVTLSTRQQQGRQESEFRVIGLSADAAQHSASATAAAVHHRT